MRLKQFLLALTAFGTLLTPVAFAAKKVHEVQFDIEAQMAGSRLTELNKTYRGEFTEEEFTIPGIPDISGPQHITLHRYGAGEELALESSETGKPVKLTFTLFISAKKRRDGSLEDYRVGASFGPGQPLNEHTRSSDLTVNNLRTFRGLEIRGEEVRETLADGTTVSSTPFLKIKHFRVLR